jgi:hypothetical protein
MALEKRRRPRRHSRIRIPRPLPTVRTQTNNGRKQVKLTSSRMREAHGKTSAQQSPTTRFQARPGELAYSWVSNLRKLLLPSARVALSRRATVGDDPRFHLAKESAVDRSAPDAL